MTASTWLFGAIPSPPDNSVGIGPLQLRAYGLAIAVGVVAGVWFAGRRWRSRGGSPDDLAAALAAAAVLVVRGRGDRQEAHPGEVVAPDTERVGAGPGEA